MSFVSLFTTRSPKSFEDNNNRESESRKSATYSAPWNYVKTFLDRPMMPFGSRRKPDIKRYSNRNYGKGVRREESGGQGAIPSPHDSVTASPRVKPPPPLGQQTPGAAGSNPGANRSARKMHRPTNMHNTSNASSDFFVKAPAPASTLSNSSAGQSGFSYNQNDLPDDILPRFPPTMPTENDSTMRPSSKPKPPNAAAPEVSGKAPVLASNQSTDASLSKSTHTPTQPSAEGLPEGWLTVFAMHGYVTLTLFDLYYVFAEHYGRWSGILLQCAYTSVKVCSLHSLHVS